MCVYVISVLIHWLIGLLIMGLDRDDCSWPDHMVTTISECIGFTVLRGINIELRNIIVIY